MKDKTDANCVIFYLNPDYLQSRWTKLRVFQKRSDSALFPERIFLFWCVHRHSGKERAGCGNKKKKQGTPSSSSWLPVPCSTSLVREFNAPTWQQPIFQLPQRLHLNSSLNTFTSPSTMWPKNSEYVLLCSRKYVVRTESLVGLIVRYCSTSLWTDCMLMSTQDQELEQNDREPRSIASEQRIRGWGVYITRDKHIEEQEIPHYEEPKYTRYFSTSCI